MTYEFKNYEGICNTIEPQPADWEKRPCIEQFDDDGNLICRSYGETEEELLQAHKEHRCGAFCGYCYHEAMVAIGAEEPTPTDLLNAHLEGTCSSGTCDYCRHANMTILGMPHRY